MGHRWKFAYGNDRYLCRILYELRLCTSNFAIVGHEPERKKMKEDMVQGPPIPLNVQVTKTTSTRYNVPWYVYHFLWGPPGVHIQWGAVPLPAGHRYGTGVNYNLRQVHYGAFRNCEAFLVFLVLPLFFAGIKKTTVPLGKVPRYLFTLYGSYNFVIETITKKCVKTHSKLRIFLKLLC